MDEIKQLEKIGLNKVSQETHIEEKYLKYMVDGNFEKLNHINTLGFIKILSREYKLNLDAWQENFEEYWQESRGDNDNKLFIYVQERKESKKLLIFIITIIFVALMAFLFNMFKDKINLENYYNTDNNNSAYEQTSVVEEAKKTLADYNEINSSDINETIAKQEIIVDEANQTVVPQETIDNNNTVEVIKKEIVKLIETKKKTENQTLLNQSNINFKNTLILEPTSKLWTGIIFLDNRTRKSYLGMQKVIIDLSKDQLITNGHGAFTLILKDTKKVFNRQSPIRFIVKDGNISEISGTKFRELNKGKLW